MTLRSDVPADLKAQVEMELARRQFPAFLQWASQGKWIPEPFLLRLCQALEGIERGTLRRLIVAIPPRHGKSEVSSRYFPVWYLGRNPDKEIILASHTAKLAANEFSLFAKQKFAEVAPLLWGLRISRNASANENWRIDGHRGGVLAAGLDGPITGRGAHCAIVDDPYKTWAEANSPAVQESVWEWYRSTLRTRLTPDGALVVIQNRWAPGDLIGRLLATLKDAEDQALHWEVLSFPAIAEQPDELGRQPGDPLSPRRFPLPMLRQTQQEIGSLMFQALYQQRPEPLEGTIFKPEWLQWYTSRDLQRQGAFWTFRGHPLTIYGGIDPATSQATWGDEFSFTTIGLTDTHEMVVLECLHGKWEPSEQYRQVEAQFRKWHHHRVGVEANGAQQYFYDQVKHLLRVHRIVTKGKKFDRIILLTRIAERGQLWFRQAFGKEPALHDLARLPAIPLHPATYGLYEQLVTYSRDAPHDDRVDSLALAWQTAQEARVRIVPLLAEPPTVEAVTVEPDQPLTTQAVPLKPGVALRVGEGLPTVVTRPPAAMPTCALCDHPLTQFRQNQGFCPTHGWQKRPPSLLERYRVGGKG